MFRIYLSGFQNLSGILLYKRIARRYVRGIENLFKIYIPLCDEWMVFDNSETDAQMMARKVLNEETEIFDLSNWNLLNDNSDDNRKK